jgi:hypothetical protein
MYSIYHLSNPVLILRASSTAMIKGFLFVNLASMFKNSLPTDSPCVSSK